MKRALLGMAIGACASTTPAPVAPAPAVKAETLAAPIEAQPVDAVANVAAHCAELVKQASMPDSIICDPSDQRIESAFRKQGPYLEARMFWEGESDTIPGNTRCELAVRTTAGWFVAEVGSDCFGRGKYKRWAHVDELAVKDVVPGGAPELVLRYHITASDPIDLEDKQFQGREDTDDAFLVVCGIDDAAALSCIDPIQLSSSRVSEVGDAAWKLDDTLANGRLALRMHAGSREVPDDARALVGVHPLKLTE